MNERHRELFETVDPPRGGLAGLRAKLDADRRRRTYVGRMQAAAAVLVVAAFVAVAMLPASGPTWTPGFSPAAVRLGLTETPSEPVTVPLRQRNEQALLRVPLDGDDVVFYLVGSRAPAPEPPASAD